MRSKIQYIAEAIDVRYPQAKSCFSDMGHPYILSTWEIQGPSPQFACLHESSLSISLAMGNWPVMFRRALRSKKQEQGNKKRNENKCIQRGSRFMIHCNDPCFTSPVTSFEESQDHYGTIYVSVFVAVRRVEPKTVRPDEIGTSTHPLGLRACFQVRRITC